MPPPEVVDAIGRILRADPERARVVADSLRAPGRSFESTVSGASMWPGLEPGMRIRVSLVPGARHEPGDVVAYLAGGKVIVHRVVHRGRGGAARGYLLTIGDATLVPDPPVEQGHVLGAVTGVSRGGGWTAPPAAPRRSLRARTVRSLSSAFALGAMYVSPGLTGRALLVFHRLLGPLREALLRGTKRPAAGLPGPR